MCFIKQNFKFEDCKNCYEATQLENEINQLEKNTLNVDSLRKNYEELINNNILILKSPRRFRSEKQNVFTVLISNHARRI